MLPTLLAINGGLGGSHGNTAQVLNPLIARLENTGKCEVKALHLAENPDANVIEKALQAAQGFVFATGTYWDCWGSPLQAFFERTTDMEAGPIWLGKPAATLVTMHSVGGKEVLSRLQGVLSTLGCLIPPMSGMTYSLANHLALQTPESRFHDDLWQLQDLNVIGHNLVEALHHSANWKSWPVDSEDPTRRWL